MAADSMDLIISVHDELDLKNVIFISYPPTQIAKSPQEIAMELQAEGGYSEEEIGKEFVKRLDNQQSKPAYQQKITEKYESLQKQFAEKGRLIENRQQS
jgi:succinate dehydrogenase/fumarate reductase flavoprotein subunit